jgi:hypothetical protein
MGRKEKNKRRDNKRIEETNAEHVRSNWKPRYHKNVDWFEKVKKREK